MIALSALALVAAVLAPEVQRLISASDGGVVGTQSHVDSLSMPLHTSHWINQSAFLPSEWRRQISDESDPDPTRLDIDDGRSASSLTRKPLLR